MFWRDKERRCWIYYFVLLFGFVFSFSVCVLNKIQTTNIFTSWAKDTSISGYRLDLRRWGLHLHDLLQIPFCLKKLTDIKTADCVQHVEEWIAKERGKGDCRHLATEFCVVGHRDLWGCAPRGMVWFVGKGKEISIKNRAYGEGELFNEGANKWMKVECW